MFIEQRPVYQPRGRSPVTSAWSRIAASMSARSTASSASLYSTHFSPCDAISQPASCIARTWAGERASAVATP